LAPEQFFDNFIWTDESGTVLAFQLCHARLDHERVLTWDGTAGFIHLRVDGGERMPLGNMIPVMVADGHFGAEHIAAEFEQRSVERDVRSRDFIRAKIPEAGAGSNGCPN
jgi:hypothetical protein